MIVLNADAGLFSSDFRGVERTGQLVMQVSGRAGRGDKAGQVVIQTYNPQHTALQTLTTNNYTQFLETLLKERADLKLPPLEYLAMVRAESANSRDCEILLQSIRHFIEQNAILGQLSGTWPNPGAHGKKTGTLPLAIINSIPPEVRYS